MPYLRIFAVWDTNEFRPYINGNHHWFRVIIRGEIVDGSTVTQVPSNVLWDARASGWNSDPNPPDGMHFGKMEDSINVPHQWYLIHNKYTLYGAVQSFGVWYTAKVEIDLDAIPPVIQQFGRSPIIQQAGSTVYVKSVPNAVIRLFHYNQTSDSYAITYGTTGFSANGRNYNRYFLSRQFSGGHITSTIVGSTGIGSFFGVADGRYVVSAIEPGRSESFMMNEFTVSGGSLSASVRQIWLEYTQTSDTRVYQGRNQRRYTMVAKYIDINNATNVQNVPLVSGVSPIKISTSNNGDYVSISSHDGWFNEGLVGLYINDSIAPTPDGNSEPGTYWTDSLQVPNVGASSEVYHDFTSLADAVARKNTVLKHTRIVYCNGEFNVGNKCWQNGTIGNCDQTPNGIYWSNLYNKAYTVLNGIITENTGDTGDTGGGGDTDNGGGTGDPNGRWGGVRTANDRGLIKDYRFTSAQQILASNGSVINTTIDIDVQRLKEGFITDKNWGNLRGASYKRWKIDEEDFRTTPLQNFPIDPLFTGFQFSLVVYYFNSGGIIIDQFQEMIQL